MSSTAIDKDRDVKIAPQTGILQTHINESFTVAVEGHSATANLMRHILVSAGCRVTTPKSGILTFSVSRDGLQLRICDEDGEWYDDGHVTALLALVFFLSGEKKLAVSASAPGAIEQIAAEYNGTILRQGRDADAKELLLAQNILCNAFSAALFLCNFLSAKKTSVRRIARSLPDFAMLSREISVTHNRLDIMRKLSERNDGLHKEKSENLRICTDGGWVSISPACSGRALRITGEGMSEEIASELCNLFIDHAREIDSGETV